MFRKIMGINDTLMWRYWGLTDATLPEYGVMGNRARPMTVKMERGPNRCDFILH
jgi:hypothetical protein